MYVPIRKYDDVYDFSSISKKLTESFAPKLYEINGFVRYCIVDIGNDSLLSISTFENKRVMEESESLAKDWRDNHPEGHMGNPTHIFHGEEKMWVLRKSS